MYQLSINKLQPGMYIARNIHSAQGLSLLNKGVCLDTSYIKRLKEFKINSVYIADSASDLTADFDFNDIVKEETRVEAVQNVFNAFNDFKYEKLTSLTSLKNSSNQIVSELLAKKDTMMIQVSDIKVYDQYTFFHSVNVAVLAITLGMQLNYPRSYLNELAFAALMHDIGKTKIPIEILHKPGSLTTTEFNIIKNHPVYSAEILSSFPNISQTIIKGVLHHHENFLGTGYPLNLRGTEIPDMSKIICIADVYDALTSDRPYKKAYLPSVAYNMMSNVLKTQFDQNMLSLFFERIAIYPLGTVLKLSNGYYSIVRKVRTNKIWRPLVEIVADRRFKKPEKAELLDLSMHPEITIDTVLTEKEALNIFYMLSIAKL